jgi:hypothetical protein
MVVELRNAILEDLHVEIAARDIFDAADLVSLADVLDRVHTESAESDAAPERTAAQDRRAAAPAIPRVRRDGPLPLSFAQRRLWFLQQMEPESTVFNIVVDVRLRGELEADALERALGGLLSRHESLRTTFHEADGSPYQRVVAMPGLRLDREDVRALGAEGAAEHLARVAAAEAGRPFDLGRARCCARRWSGSTTASMRWFSRSITSPPTAGRRA